MNLIETIFIVITFVLLITFIVTSLVIIVKQKDRVLKIASLISFIIITCLTVALVIFII